MDPSEHKALLTSCSNLEQKIAESRTALSNILLRIQNLKTQINLENSEKSRLEQEISAYRKQIANLNRSKKGNQPLIVSEHAILRYIERVIGIKPNDIAEKILSDKDRKSFDKSICGTFPVNGTHKIRVKDGVIVTVLSVDSDEDD